jgi:hypothetical protein
MNELCLKIDICLTNMKALLATLPQTWQHGMSAYRRLRVIGHHNFKNFIRENG